MPNCLGGSRAVPSRFPHELHVENQYNMALEAPRHFPIDFFMNIDRKSMHNGFGGSQARLRAPWAPARLSKRPPRRLQDDPRGLQDAPRGFQDLPKSICYGFLLPTLIPRTAKSCVCIFSFHSIFT